ncbi:MAG TPA: pitrilysin family protein [Myxococcales bacterium]|nr:pitrilysin family protein [Myxococcales bacterium]
MTRDIALPPHEIAHEASGLTLLAVQRRAVPLFHARLSVPAGASEDPRGKAGLAQFTADLLRRGTMRRDARGVDELIESMGTGLGIEVSLDEAALSLTVPADLSRQALDALLEVALQPSFPENEVASARRRTLASLQSDLDEPSSVAARAVVALGYGAQHPYGHPAHGFRRDVETFQREDALGFHASRFNARGALLAVVGTAPPADQLAFVRERLVEVKWPSEARRAPLDFASLPRQGMRALVWHKPDSTQAQVRIVASAIPRRSPLYMPGVVQNAALGGGFTSLLVDAIRVDRGLSYSVSSRLLMARHAGLSVFSSFTKNETLRELLDVALQKMHDYARTGPSGAALTKAKAYLGGLFPLGLESHEALAEQIADSILDGLGVEHLATYRSRLAAVTAAQARDAAAQLSPARDGTQIFVVGDGEVGRKALADLCPVDVRPIEELA